MVIYTKPIDDRAVEALAEAVEILVPVITCPFCGAEIDEWCDCGCYADIMYGKD